MNIHQFRSTPELLIEFRGILQNPVMQQALAALAESNPVIDAREPDMDAIASVRILSQLMGYNTCLNAFRLLAEPIRPNVELEAEFKPEV